MKQKLSPKKYLETQVRKLPVYKCLINKEWEETQMANVIIMRRHINGNITLGIYLVDLLCLGIKDTFYKFNIPESEANEKFENNEGLFEELDYNTAHNIVFAGHDFAMDFDIPPHKDFALTKNILEEDDDRVPLIDIPVGDLRDGKPHLMINPYGQGKWALEKLKKNAGEGNYYYTTGADIDMAGESFDDSGPFNDDFEDDESFAEIRTMLIDEYEPGTISAFAAKGISTPELFETEKINQRDDIEILNLTVESMIRVFEIHPDYAVLHEDEFINTTEFIFTESCDSKMINCLDKQIYIHDLDTEGYIDEDLEILYETTHEFEELEDVAKKILHKHSSNFYALSELYKLTVLSETELAPLRKEVCAGLNNFIEIYPLAKLFLAFESICNNIPDLRFANIQYSADIRACFPEYERFGAVELQIYWLIKTLKSIKDDSVEDSIFYYQLAVETLQENEFLKITQAKIIVYFNAKIA